MLHKRSNQSRQQRAKLITSVAEEFLANDMNNNQISSATVRENNSKQPYLLIYLTRPAHLTLYSRNAHTTHWQTIDSAQEVHEPGHSNFPKSLSPKPTQSNCTLIALLSQVQSQSL